MPLAPPDNFCFSLYFCFYAFPLSVCIISQKFPEYNNKPVTMRLQYGYKSARIYYSL